MVQATDISVIVQGAIDASLTPRCLKSLRRYLPGAEIILSTWKGAKVDGLDFDVLVESDDPGAYVANVAFNRINNVNRQLVSTQAGLAKASRRFSLKLRSDAVLEGASFLHAWDKFPARDAAYALFEHRILAASVYARETMHGTGVPTLFHPSDLWFMGLTSDLAGYFAGTPLMSPQEAADWTYKHPSRVPDASFLWRYAPEQYFLAAFLKRRAVPAFSFDDWSDWNADTVGLSHRILYNNFVFLGVEQSGIAHPKHAQAESNEDKIDGLITYGLFQRRYREYCDPAYTPDTRAEKRLKRLRKLQKAFQIFTSPFVSIYRWIKSFFNVILCAVQYLASK